MQHEKKEQTPPGWSEPELAAWRPKRGRELSIAMAQQRLQPLLQEAEAMHSQLQAIVKLLEMDDGPDKA